MGHEERFPPTRLSAGCGFSKETIAGMRRNGRDAPTPAVRGVKRGHLLLVAYMRSKLDMPICGSPVVPRTTGVGATSGTLC